MQKNKVRPNKEGLYNLMLNVPGEPKPVVVQVGNGAVQHGARTNTLISRAEQALLGLGVEHSKRGLRRFFEVMIMIR
jgi:hypothetical protein